MNIFKIPRRYRRYLKQYRCVARIEHGPCHQCNRPIMPGEYYVADVEVTEFGFSISKTHYFCPEDFWREEEEMVKQADAHFEAERAANELAAAA